MINKLLNVIKKPRRRSLSPFCENILEGDKNAMIARQIILNDLNAVLDGGGISCTSRNRVHAVIVGSDDLMLSLAKQIALVSHYPNFDDETGCNRTKITIIDTAADDDLLVAEVVDRVNNKLGNLMCEALWRAGLASKDGFITLKCSTRQQSFIDIELEIAGLKGVDADQYVRTFMNAPSNELITLLCRTDVLSADTVKLLSERINRVEIVDESRYVDSIDFNSVDMRMARMVNMVYVTGSSLKDIPLVDLYKVNAYNNTLSKLLSSTAEELITREWECIDASNKEYPSYARDIKLSNLFCADSFPTKIRSIKIDCKRVDKNSFKKALADNIEKYSKCEHARWNVEKLILGYRPLGPQESYRCEYLFGSDLARECSRLKKGASKMHFDLCSMRRLMQIDPESFKYDCFLTLCCDDIYKLSGDDIFE